MSYGCSMDGEPAEHWQTLRPVARKEHTCSECGCTIERREEYVRVKYLFDGRWHEEVWCAPCHEQAKTLWHLQFYWEPGDMDVAWVAAYRGHDDAQRYQEFLAGTAKEAEPWMEAVHSSRSV